jgi:hypothetical protein
MNIPVEIEAEFNDWYTNEHVAERVDLPGFKSAFRFVAADASPKYFAYYETESKFSDNANLQGDFGRPE